MLTESRIKTLWTLIEEKNALETRIAKEMLKATKPEPKPNGHGSMVVMPKTFKSATNTRYRKPSAKKVLQGKYLGAVRSLSKKDKKAVAKIRVENGYRAAITKAKELAS